MKKKNFTFYIDNLNFNKILSIQILLSKNKKKDLRLYYLLLRSFLNTIYKSIFFSPIIRLSKKKGPQIFYIRSFSRDDLVMHSECYERIEGTTICILDKKKICIDIVTFLYSIFLLYKSRKYWIKCLNIKKVSFFSLVGLDVFLKLFISVSDVLKIYPFLSTHSKLVSFIEINPTENIICQLANMNNIETFALEHAVAMYKKRGDFWERLGAQPYLNSVCHNILCWGNYSKNNYKNYTDAKIYIIGKAYLPIVKNIFDGVTFVFQNADQWTCTNNKLLDISKDLADLKVSVSLRFKRKDKSFQQKKYFFNEQKFGKIVIGCSSNLLLELGYLGLKVYVIKDSILSKSLPNRLVLENPNLIYNEIKSQKNYPYGVWKNFIQCTGNKSVARYKSIVMNNMNNFKQIS